MKRAVSRPELCLVCPFDLGRVSGSPLRARATVEALRGRADLTVLATTGAEGAVALSNILSRDPCMVSIPRFCAAAFRALLHLRPRVIHCFTPLAALPALAARPFLGATRIVVEVHGAAEYELRHARPHVRAFFASLDRHLIRRADAVVAMGERHANYLRARCGVHVPICVSWGPIDVTRNGSVGASPAAVRRFGYFGNASVWQGLDDLVGAARLCPPDLLRVSVTGVDVHELPRGAEEVVEINGRAPRGEMLEAMGGYDVLVSPRRGGPVGDLQYPFKLSAYLAAGRAVLGTDVGDQGLIIRRAQCGAVVRPGSPSELAQAMTRIARADDDELVQLGRRARRFAEEHLGYDRLRGQLSELYGIPIS